MRHNFNSTASANTVNYKPLVTVPRHSSSIYTFENCCELVHRLNINRK